MKSDLRDGSQASRLKMRTLTGDLSTLAGDLAIPAGDLATLAAESGSHPGGSQTHKQGSTPGFLRNHPVAAAGFPDALGFFCCTCFT